MSIAGMLIKLACPTGCFEYCVWPSKGSSYRDGIYAAIVYTNEPLSGTSKFTPLLRILLLKLSRHSDSTM